MKGARQTALGFLDSLDAPADLSQRRRIARVGPGSQSGSPSRSNPTSPHHRRLTHRFLECCSVSYLAYGIWLCSPSHRPSSRAHDQRLARDRQTPSWRPVLSTVRRPCSFHVGHRPASSERAWVCACLACPPCLLGVVTRHTLASLDNLSQAWPGAADRPVALVRTASRSPPSLLLFSPRRALSTASYASVAAQTKRRLWSSIRIPVFRFRFFSSLLRSLS